MKPDPLGEAVAALEDGELVAFPTETVWGLGADARRDAAVERLCDWKGRERDAPLSILVADRDDLVALDFELGPAAARVADAFWPGPLTLVLRCRRRFAAGVARADGAVGVRCSSHPLAAALARRLRAERVGPITATSLNRSGEAPARSRAEARTLCGRESESGSPRLLDVDGAEAGGEDASTVIDLTKAPPAVLRWGAVAAADLELVLPELQSA